MSSKDKYTLEAAKKKKTTIKVVSAKSNQNGYYNVSTTTSAYYATKPETEKSDKSQKSARTVKVDVPKQLLKQERSFKALNNYSTKSSTSNYSENYALKPKTSTAHSIKNTNNNQEILEQAEMRYGLRENYDPNQNAKRWSDLPIRSNDIGYGLCPTQPIGVSSRQKNEYMGQTMDDSNISSSSKSDKYKNIHNRNGSTGKNLRPADSFKNQLNTKITSTRPATKTLKPSSSAKSEAQLSNSLISLTSQDTIIEEDSPYNMQHKGGGQKKSVLNKVTNQQAIPKGKFLRPKTQETSGISNASNPQVMYLNTNLLNKKEESENKSTRESGTFEKGIISLDITKNSSKINTSITTSANTTTTSIIKDDEFQTQANAPRSHRYYPSNQSNIEAQKMTEKRTSKEDLTFDKKSSRSSNSSIATNSNSGSGKNKYKSNPEIRSISQIEVRPYYSNDAQEHQEKSQKQQHHQPTLRQNTNQSNSNHNSAKNLPPTSNSGSLSNRYGSNPLLHNNSSNPNISMNTSTQSGPSPTYISAHNNSYTSSNGKNSGGNNKSFQNTSHEVDNNKKSSGKFSNPNSSNNSSYMKAKNSYTKSHKTESTNISGGDSPSNVLDCDETLTGTNFTAILNNKNDNNYLMQKFDFERADLFLNNDKASSTNKLDPFQTEFMNPAANVSEEKEETLEEAVQNFQIDDNACAIDSDTINYLVMREMDYCPDPHYFEKKQDQVTWIMRAILIDWMMEVSMEFTLKRETFHYALNYVDRYLSTEANIEKWELQLIGVTAMYIAAKVEEIYAPKVSDFAKSADNGYTTQQIMEMEQKMLKSLKWYLNPPTLNTWANWYLSQWDLYIENSPYAQQHPLISECEDGPITFKQPNEKAYARFREVMQLIDCSILDIHTLQYKTRTLVAAFMYMVLGRHFKQFTTEQIYEEFPSSSLYLLDQEYAFNDLFSDFLLYTFGFQLIDLLPSIQYASTYFKFQLNFELPTAAKTNKENVLEGHFEEFLAYQTHHPLNVDYIRKRPRAL